MGGLDAGYGQFPWAAIITVTGNQSYNPAIMFAYEFDKISTNPDIRRVVCRIRTVFKPLVLSTITTIGLRSRTRIL